MRSSRTHRRECHPWLGAQHPGTYEDCAHSPETGGARQEALRGRGRSQKPGTSLVTSPFPCVPVPHWQAGGRARSAPGTIFPGLPRHPTPAPAFCVPQSPPEHPGPCRLLPARPPQPSPRAPGILPCAHLTALGRVSKALLSLSVGLSSVSSSAPLRASPAPAPFLGRGTLSHPASACAVPHPRRPLRARTVRMTGGGGRGTQTPKGAGARALPTLRLSYFRQKGAWRRLLSPTCRPDNPGTGQSPAPTRPRCQPGSP